MNKILIIKSNYYKNISQNLLQNSVKKLKSKKIKISVIETPGIFEIPVTIKMNIKKFDAFIALGCVIKGDTPHFNLICSSTFDAIMQLSIKYDKPIGNGIITALNMRQAVERSSKIGSLKPNKGAEAAHAVLSILANDPKKI